MRVFLSPPSIFQKYAYICRHENIKISPMKARLTKILLTLFTVFAIVPCLAQQRSTIRFNYDANGNRTIRQIEIGGNKGGAENGDDKVSPSIDIFEALSIALYPNPTNGLFYTVIKGDKGNANLHAIITTTTGEIIVEKNNCNETEYFDLTKHPAGVYLLKLTVDEESHVWRVIKN